MNTFTYAIPINLYHTSFIYTQYAHQHIYAFKEKKKIQENFNSFSKFCHMEDQNVSLNVDEISDSIPSHVVCNLYTEDINGVFV